MRSLPRIILVILTVGIAGYLSTFAVIDDGVEAFSDSTERAAARAGIDLVIMSYRDNIAVWLKVPRIHVVAVERSAGQCDPATTGLPWDGYRVELLTYTWFMLKDRRFVLECQIVAASAASTAARLPHQNSRTSLPGEEALPSE
jgi:hypothetical protein